MQVFSFFNLEVGSDRAPGPQQWDLIQVRIASVLGPFRGGENSRSAQPLPRSRRRDRKNGAHSSDLPIRLRFRRFRLEDVARASAGREFRNRSNCSRSTVRRFCVVASKRGQLTQAGGGPKLNHARPSAGPMRSRRGFIHLRLESISAAKSTSPIDSVSSGAAPRFTVLALERKSGGEVRQMLRALDGKPQTPPTARSREKCRSLPFEGKSRAPRPVLLGDRLNRAVRQCGLLV